MKARFVEFGEVEIDGKRYTKDVVIEGGRVRKRDKGPSKPRKAEFGHTPLTAAEAIPWQCQRLIIGTGAQGSLPVTEDVYARARDEGVTLVVVPTREACKLLSAADLGTTNAILHLTC